MHYEVKHAPQEPAWTVIEVNGDVRKVVETHYGDHCDANERRYARERALALARTLARKNNTRVVQTTV